MPRCGLPAVVLAITELYGKGLVNMNNEIKQAAFQESTGLSGK